MKILQRECSLHLLTASFVVSVCLASPGATFAQTQRVEPIGGKPLILYDAPGKPSAHPNTDGKPLLVEGADKGGFVPVQVDGQHYWVDGMDVRRSRQSIAPCTQSAGVPAAGTLGAATNRCGSK